MRFLILLLFFFAALPVYASYDLVRDSIGLRQYVDQVEAEYDLSIQASSGVVSARAVDTGKLFGLMAVRVPTTFQANYTQDGQYSFRLGQPFYSVLVTGITMPGHKEQKIETFMGQQAGSVDFSNDSKTQALLIEAFVRSL